MKIYEIGTGYTPIPATQAAATESVVEELTKAFITQGIDCEIIDVSAEQRAPHSLPINEVKVPPLFSRSDVSLGVIHKVKRVVYSIALAFYLKKLLRAANEKVVLHFHNQYNLFFFLKLVPHSFRDKAYIVYTNHNGMWSLPYDEVKQTLRKRYFQEIAAMKGADQTFVLNAKTKESIVKNLDIPEDKIVQIANGVNADIYRPVSENQIDEIKQRYGLSGRKVILQIGSVNENKGQARSVEMLLPALKENPDLVYAYVGGIVSQEYYEKVQSTADKLGVKKQVMYLGTVSPGEEMNEIYNIATATLFVSQYEGFPLVCIESLSAGIPVIICSSHIPDFGDGCIKTDISSLGDTVKNVILEFTEYSTIARDNAKNNFSWQKIAQTYYGEIIKGIENQKEK